MAAKKWKASLDGQEELIRRLKAILTIVRKEVGRINYEVALRGADRARGLVPVRTGALLESIDVVGSGMTWRFGSFGYEGRAMVPVWVEYGTSRTPAHPYLHPASEGARSALPKETQTIARELPFLVAKA
jgi:hypothetical protein